MAIIDPGGLKNLIEAAVTAVSVLGGFMAYLSGYAASKAVAARAPAEVVAEQLNRGLASGFDWGAWIGLIAFVAIIAL